MIGSVTEFDAQMREQMRRRQEIAARQAAQQAAAAVPPAAAPVTGGLAGAVAGAGYAPAGVALKAGEPDIVKRKQGGADRRGVAGDAEELREHPGDRKRGKGKGRKGDRVGRDLAKDPMTDAHESARAGGHAAKAYQDRGATEGPDEPVMPGHAAPQQFDRPYIESGHAAESPMAEPPRSFPLIDDHPQAEDFRRGASESLVAGAPRQMPIVHAPQGMVQPIELPGAPVAGYVPAHVTQALSMGSPSDK